MTFCIDFNFLTKKQNANAKTVIRKRNFYIERFTLSFFRFKQNQTFEFKRTIEKKPFIRACGMERILNDTTYVTIGNRQQQHKCQGKTAQFHHSKHTVHHIELVKRISAFSALLLSCVRVFVYVPAKLKVFHYIKINQKKKKQKSIQFQYY